MDESGSPMYNMKRNGGKREENCAQDKKDMKQPCDGATKYQHICTSLD